MPFEPKHITKEHIVGAIARINREKIELKPSTRWDVIINGKAYPPKEVMRYAHREMSGEALWEYSGGESTNKWLKQLGFVIVDKWNKNDPILALIERYKADLNKYKLKNELYKWRLVKTFNGKPNVSAPNFTEELTSINWGNLIYPAGISVITDIAKEKPEELRGAFKNLFDESVDLRERIKIFNEETLKFYRDIFPDSSYSHHQDERTIATYLAYHNSLKYPFYKDSCYQKYCKLIGVKPAKRGDKYIHYLSLLDEFITNYILEDSELLDLKSELLTEDCFDDSNHKIFAQDILYFHSNLDEQKGLNKTEQKMANELNQILFGPPGTGKTYNTINKALELCGEDLTGLKRQDIKERFEQKVNEGKIVFTTFHQSMTYEDFVESIKPIEPEKEGDPIIYRVEEGIFRRLCIEAAFSLAKEEESETTETVLDFSFAFDEFVQEIEKRLTSEQQVELVTKNGGMVIVDGISPQGSILIKHPGKNNIYPVTKQRLSKLHVSFPDLSEIHNIDQQFRSVIGGSNSTANWSVLNAIRNNNLTPSYSNENTRKYTWEEKKEVVQTLKNEDYKNKKGEPFVLIIDEINRGNISQIFGELITLIEEDKRLGNAEALQVQLPYSKDSFGVPPNVYIIGTMNTADRSVEALDTALRRRFSFIEISPNCDLIKTESKAKDGLINGIDLSNLLEIMNKRVERLLDKDHMIGHSYLLTISTLDDLKAAFQNKIIPLLQEYFYGDYGKIGLVIGSDFFEIKENQVEEEFFAPFDDYEISALLEKRIYHIRNVIAMEDENFITAIDSLLRKA